MSKFELKHCKKCNCMANHYTTPKGSVCGKCGLLEKNTLPPGWGKLFGLGEK